MPNLLAVSAARLEAERATYYKLIHAINAILFDLLFRIFTDHTGAVDLRTSV
jgi:hypothetical protein